MVRIMKSQVVAKIKVTDIVIESCFKRGKRNSETDNFLNMIVKTLLDSIISTKNLNFKLCFDVRNGSSGNGSKVDNIKNDRDY